MLDWLGLDVFNTGPTWIGARTAGAVSVRSSSQPPTRRSRPSRTSRAAGRGGSSENGGSKAYWITSALTTELPMFHRVEALVWADIVSLDI